MYGCANSAGRNALHPVVSVINKAVAQSRKSRVRDRLIMADVVLRVVQRALLIPQVHPVPTCGRTGDWLDCVRFVQSGAAARSTGRSVPRAGVQARAMFPP